MSTAGPNGPTLGTDDGSIGSISWNGPGNIYVVDGIYATATLNFGQISHYLVAQTFGFSIPSTATIVGILAEVLCMGTGSALIEDQSVILLKAGVQNGTDKAVVTQWNNFPSLTYRSYGGAADLWAGAWAPADINGALFGLSVSAKNFAPGIGIAYVDYVRITVTFTSSNQVKQQCIVVKPPQAAYDLTQRPD